MANFSVIEVENKGTHPIRTIILPDNSVVIAMHQGSNVYEVIQGEKIVLPKIHLCGQLTHQKEYIREPGSKTTLIKFCPWNLQMNLRNLHELTDQNTDFKELTKTDALPESADGLDIPAFLGQFGEKKNIDRSILHALQIIHDTKGSIKVEELAYQVCNSKRNFERNFKSITGLTPKEYIKNTRFAKSLELMKTDESLTGIGYDCGYYDQSHFTHQFKEIAGVSPEQYTEVIQPVENWALASKSYRDR
jgi:AraC-like DNA-binding protein